MSILNKKQQELNTLRTSFSECIELYKNIPEGKLSAVDKTDIVKLNNAVDVLKNAINGDSSADFKETLEKAADVVDKIENKLGTNGDVSISIESSSVDKSEDIAKNSENYEDYVKSCEEAGIPPISELVYETSGYGQNDEDKEETVASVIDEAVDFNNPMFKKLGIGVGAGVVGSVALLLALSARRAKKSYEEYVKVSKSEGIEPLSRIEYERAEELAELKKNEDDEILSIRKKSEDERAAINDTYDAMIERANKKSNKTESFSNKDESKKEREKHARQEEVVKKYYEPFIERIEKERGKKIPKAARDGIYNRMYELAEEDRLNEKNIKKEVSPLLEGLSFSELAKEKTYLYAKEMFSRDYNYIPDNSDLRFNDYILAHAKHFSAVAAANIKECFANINFNALEVVKDTAVDVGIPTAAGAGTGAAVGVAYAIAKYNAAKKAAIENGVDPSTINKADFIRKYATRGAGVGGSLGLGLSTGDKFLKHLKNKRQEAAYNNAGNALERIEKNKYKQTLNTQGDGITESDTESDWYNINQRHDFSGKDIGDYFKKHGSKVAVSAGIGGGLTVLVSSIRRKLRYNEYAKKAEESGEQVISQKEFDKLKKSPSLLKEFITGAAVSGTLTLGSDLLRKGVTDLKHSQKIMKYNTQGDETASNDTVSDYISESINRADFSYKAVDYNLTNFCVTQMPIYYNNLIGALDGAKKAFQDLYGYSPNTLGDMSFQNFCKANLGYMFEDVEFALNDSAKASLIGGIGLGTVGAGAGALLAKKAIRKAEAKAKEEGRTLTPSERNKITAKYMGTGALLGGTVGAGAGYGANKLIKDGNPMALKTKDMLGKFGSNVKDRAKGTADYLTGAAAHKHSDELQGYLNQLKEKAEKGDTVAAAELLKYKDKHQPGSASSDIYRLAAPIAMTAAIGTATKGVSNLMKDKEEEDEEENENSGRK